MAVSVILEPFSSVETNTVLLIELWTADSLGVIHKLWNAIRREGVGLCVTLGHKVYKNGSKKNYRGEEGVQNLPKICYVLYEHPLVGLSMKPDLWFLLDTWL